VRASIGPAGENLIRGSVISNDKRHIAAKAGDVMGSKRLKAIVVGGGERIPVPVADPEGLRRLPLTGGSPSQERERSEEECRKPLHLGKPEFFGDRSPWILWVKNLSDPHSPTNTARGSGVMLKPQKSSRFLASIAISAVL